MKVQPRPKTSEQSFMPFTSASNGLAASFSKVDTQAQKRKTCAFSCQSIRPWQEVILPQGTLRNRTLPWRRHTDISQTRTRAQIVRVTTTASLMLQMWCHLRYLFPKQTPSFEEFGNCVRQAWNGSAPGPNGIPYVVWKYCPSLKRRLYTICQKVWSTGKTPSSWSQLQAVIVLFHKSGTTSDPTNFGPIALSNCDGKLFFSLYLNILLATWSATSTLTNKHRKDFARYHWLCRARLHFTRSSSRCPVASPLNLFCLGWPSKCFWECSTHACATLPA